MEERARIGTRAKLGMKERLVMFVKFARTSPRTGSGRLLLAALATVLMALGAATAEAKTPGKTYCFNGICHKVKSIPEMVTLVGREESLTASFYDHCKRDRYNPCGLTSSGEHVRPGDADNAASPIYPDGTVLLLRNPGTGEAAVVRVTNAGPYWGKRKLDVSRATAEKLGFKKRGVAKLQVKIISAPNAAEARYKKNRRYDAVPGPLGSYSSMAAAHAGMIVAMTNMPKATRVAAAGGLSERFANAGDGEGTPADGLRAAARRALGLEPEIRRIAPSTLTAEALYARMRGQS